MKIFEPGWPGLISPKNPALAFITRVSVLVLLCLVSQARSEITLDGTLGLAGSLSSVNSNYTISADLGKQTGCNLFHSFGTFDIRMGESATFTGPDSVDNIISRVTGGSSSQIDGLLRSEIPGANLFLINPWGVMFGPEASLDIHGSFHVSTADYLSLGKQGRFNVRQPKNSVLTTEAPSAFGFLSEDPGPVEFQGSGSAFVENYLGYNGITVPQGETLSVIGGDIKIADGMLWDAHEVETRLRAPGGQINIASLASEGEVMLIDGNPDISSFEKHGNILLSGKSNIDVSGSTSGKICIIGENFVVKDMAYVFAINGHEDGSLIDIHMTGELQVDEGGQIGSVSLGPGKGSNISISADTLTVSGNGLISADSGVLINRQTTIGGKGDGGNITLNANRLEISGGTVSTNTLDSGESGNISVFADIVNITDEGVLMTDNGIIFPDDKGMITAGAVVGGKGDSGNIALDVSHLEMDKGAISSNSLGTGKGGIISIVADKSVSIAGSGAEYSEHLKDKRYGIGSQTLGSGNGGHISIRTDALTLTKDAMINGQTYGSGNGGNVTLDVGQLDVHSGGTITTSTRCTGDAGNISITARESVNVSGAGVKQENSWIYTATHSYGRGGDLKISAPALTVGECGAIYADTLGDDTDDDCKGFTGQGGRAGDIFLDADYLELSDGGLVSAHTKTEGRGGDIGLETGQLKMRDGSIISSESSEAGDAGDISIRAANTIHMENSAVTTAAEDADGGNISVIARHMLDMRDSEITATVGGGQGDGGNISISPESAVLDDSRIIANAYEGDGGNIRIVSDGFVQSSTSVVSASSELGIDGSVEIESADITGGLTVLPADFLDAARWMRTPCSARTGEDASHLTAGRRDGIPTQPDDWLASPPPALGDISAADVPTQHLLRGWQNYQNGEFAHAAHAWEQAIGYSDIGEEAYVPMLVCLISAYQAVGRYQDALASLRRMLPAAEKSGNSGHYALFLSALGDLSLSLGKAAEAEEYLTKGSEQARLAGNPVILASVLNNLGNVLAADGDYQKAVANYEECLGLIGESERTGDLRSQALTNLARVRLLAGEDDAEISNALNLAFRHISNAPDSFHKASTLISLGVIAQKAENGSCRSVAYQASEAARQIGEKLNDTILMSLSCGYLGQLYETDARYSDALAQTRRALFRAQQKNVPEILYQWQWQLGRLFRKLGQADKSVKAYQDAIATLNPIRTEFFSGWRDRRDIFHEKVRPVYLELADLLLRQASAAQDEKLGKTKLRQAADTMDTLKTAEFQDYFEDECVTSGQTKLTESGRIPSRAAVIYPIIFPERLELLVMFPDDIRQITVSLGSGHLVKSAKRFRQRLEKASDTKRILYYARPLYDWLIRPLEDMLDSRGTDTLIVTPDGVLRMIPFSALHDGEQFLIEKYAVATIPAITLTDTGSAETGNTGILLNGLSEGVQGFDPLPGVEKEFDEISRLAGHSEVLLNQDYTTANLFAKLRGRDYSSILMATHGVFGGTPGETFLLTYDDKLTMDQLEELIGLGRFRRKQAELLMLSACQTALGDERAALGLAGVALKAGARSALATLWSVYDESAAMAVTEFQRQLGTPGISKARALRNAQMHLIAQPEYEHPVHWAPFLLIGNWS